MALTDSGVRTLWEAHNPVLVTLAEACDAGDLLGYSSGWKLANAAAGTAIAARLVAGQKGAIGDTITGYPIAKLDGFTGATPGAKVYLAKVAGQYTDAAPAVAGDIRQTVGYSVSATEVVICLHADEVTV